MGERLHDGQRKAHVRADSARHMDCLWSPRNRCDPGDGEGRLDRAGQLNVVFDVGVWALSLIFLLRAVGNLRSFGFFKTVKGTPFGQWDTWLYSPLCLLLALLAAGMAMLPSER